MAVGQVAATARADLEHLSSLIDGELDAQQAAAVVDALCRHPELQTHWSDLQLVGDALRSSEVAACHVDGFCARVSRALAAEPTVLAPPRRKSPALRRYLMPGAAVAASMAAIAFVAVPLLQSPAGDVTAQRTPPVPAQSVATAASAEPKAAAAIANARVLDAYFAAHRELTGGTPLPRATAYLRTSGGDR